MKLDPLQVVIEDVRNGKPIVLIDDEDRENEGDLMVAADRVTPESLNFMMQHGKGLICVSLTQARLAEIGVPMQATENNSAFGTNFAVSFDLASLGAQSLTAEGRSGTIKAVLKENACASDFVMPGYVFPVAAVPGGVLKRRGQTEGSVDLSAIAGLAPAGVICEIMSEQGSMLRGPELMEYCKHHDLKITSVEELVRYRLHEEVSIRRVAERVISPELGIARTEALGKLFSAGSPSGLRVVLYVDDIDDSEHLAIIKGELSDGALVRIHSECLTGDVFGSARCDCGDQFDKSLELILKEDVGVLVYLHQEGRGIGLANKLRAYELQDQGLDTIDANEHLGFAADERDYRVGAQILGDLGLSSVRLITNNPEKMTALDEFGVSVAERIALPVCISKHNAKYMETKQRRMGHLFSTE